ncbi:MAG: sulfate adenylyltransferase [Desulfovibrio sp.]|jgi:sulfate adenylyltransferase|nr:sulfate adenylyltransferase [Desulfovibrio sp.]
MSAPVPAHGGKGLTVCLLEGRARAQEVRKAAGLAKVEIGSAVFGDLIMIAVGAFSPLRGFMDRADRKSVCDNFCLTDGTFWPVPVVLDASEREADGLAPGQEIALFFRGESVATMRVDEISELDREDRERECLKIFRGSGPDSTCGDFMERAAREHPGVRMVLTRKAYALAGPVKALSEGSYPADYPGVYLRPAELRAELEKRGWSDVAALQLRNPMHRSHEYLAKIAGEICDGVVIHSLIGNLKPGDIPAGVRIRAIRKLLDAYFVPDRVIQAGYPLDMRYAGPREALLHALFRQNFGINRLIVGRDHAGVGDFYGIFEAQDIFSAIPRSGDPARDLQTVPLKIDWTFYCRKCDGMASLRTCPHDAEDRVILSGTKLRKLLSEGGEIPDHFSRPEALEVLREYYAGLDEKTEIALHGAAAGPQPRRT